MKYDPNKAYLHPVLRPGSTDYPKAEFQVELEVDRIQDTTAVRVSAEFELSDPDLLRLIEEEAARYVLLVRATATHHRSAHHSGTPDIVAEFANGQLAGRTEVRGLLVAVHDSPGFLAGGWHDDYQGGGFDISAGDVLADDEPKEYWIDNAEEAPIGSVFTLEAQADLSDGRWKCGLGGERVTLRMSADDYQRFMDARERVNGTPDVAYVMNAVYLPALVHVLKEADGGGDRVRRSALVPLAER